MKKEQEKHARYEALSNRDDMKFVRFKGSVLAMTPYSRGFEPVNRDDFARVCYQDFPGISTSGINELLDYIRTQAEDRSHLSHVIWFGDKAWDMQAVEWSDKYTQGVYSTDIAPNPNTEPVMEYLLQLANGSEELANDYLQSMAPLLLEKRPTGVVWFIGSGANGKSSLLNALYRILGKYFASLTTAAIEDGRDTPRLNGVLGNIVRESSESRVEDTERYKAIGTHESFTVHKFHSQDSITIHSDFHTIFNANNVPVFADKTHGARRRTLVVPFPAKFADDPDFEDRTFTPSFLGGLVTLLAETAQQIKANSYRYKWSDSTVTAKESYDSEVNSAEAYLTYLNDNYILGFKNYNLLRMQYEIWCGKNGLVPLGVTTLRRVMRNDGMAERSSYRNENGTVQSVYVLTSKGSVLPSTLDWWDNGLATSGELRGIEKEEVKEKRLSDEW